ncbi:TenA family transcriptional regulator [Euzebya sp.]|uniref:TenA family transcriptional regulator n=1 Tax=Euzebya sp. TaxID=1971409 RepID=UPI0035114999
MSTSSALITAHPDAWRAATTSPFLDGIADGSLPADAFDRWLEQDHRFVETLVRAWGRLLGSAPRRDMGLLVGGMRAFVDELAWFEDIAAVRGLDLDGPELPATAAYDEVLMDLAGRAYPVAITAMWAVEAAYLAAWQRALPGAEAYAEYVTHWANDAFAAFVTDLGRVVDRELPDGPTSAATDAFLVVARHEAAFWAMTLG